MSLGAIVQIGSGSFVVKIPGKELGAMLRERVDQLRIEHNARPSPLGAGIAMVAPPRHVRSVGYEPFDERAIAAETKAHERRQDISLEHRCHWLLSLAAIVEKSDEVYALSISDLRSFELLGTLSMHEVL